MIDKKWLRDLEIMISVSSSGSSAFIKLGEPPPIGTFALDKTYLEEFIRLARLGLWAEEYGIPMLESFAEMEKQFHESKDGRYATKVLETLPKVKE